MIKQWESSRPMVARCFDDEQHLVVFSEDIDQIPERIRLSYQLQLVDVAPVTNWEKITKEVEVHGYKCGVIVPDGVDTDRLASIHLRLMQD